MKEVAEIMDNIVTRLTALTADTQHGGTTAFRHIEQTYDPEDITDARSPTRKFMLALTGSRDLINFLGQEGEMTSVRQTFEVALVYAQGKSAHALMKVIAEDVDQIGRDLMKADGFDTPTTGLERRTVTSYSVSLGDQGGSAIVTIPVECRYTPTYS